MYSIGVWVRRGDCWDWHMTKKENKCHHVWAEISPFWSWYCKKCKRVSLGSQENLLGKTASSLYLEKKNEILQKL